ncbi:hypothetical protein PO909_016012 [Leuciscus waleckii]
MLSPSTPAPSLLDVCTPAPSLGIPCQDAKPQVMQLLAAPVLEDPAAPLLTFDLFAPSRPVGSALAPPTFSSTRDPYPTGSPLVYCHTAFATDFRAVRYSPTLHPFGCSGFLPPAGYVSVLSHTVIAPVLGCSIARCLGLQNLALSVIGSRSAPRDPSASTTLVVPQISSSESFLTPRSFPPHSALNMHISLKTL